MNNKFYSILYFSFFLAFAYLLWNVYALKSDLNTQNQITTTYGEKSNENEAKYNTLFEHYELSLRASKKAEGVKANLYPYSNEVSTSNVLVLRIHRNDCNDCVKQSLKLLGREAIGKKMKVFILADYPDSKAVESDFGVVNYPIFIQDEYPLDLPKVSKPYFFVLGPGANNAKKFFFPNWQFMGMLETYLSNL